MRNESANDLKVSVFSVLAHHRRVLLKDEPMTRKDRDQLTELLMLIEWYVSESWANTLGMTMAKEGDWNGADSQWGEWGGID